MSEVISFRLNKDNLREAQALEILEAWRSKGYSVRQTIIEALLKLDDPGLESREDNNIPDLNAVLNQVNKLLEQIGNGGYSLYHKLDENPEKSNLAENFVSSIKEALKPGLRL
jgi:hypothetical protein